ncbi:MAG: hypothetical protein JO038_01425 [Alphaproteobacteria bacterium]|nr:hypothetical protein [Alphaproteobacteria bacterium]
MTLAEAAEIFRYWEAHPPAHLLLGGLFGRKPANRSVVIGRGEELPPGLAAIRGELGMPMPELDPEGLRRRNRARAAEIAMRNAAPKT